MWGFLLFSFFRKHDFSVFCFEFVDAFAHQGQKQPVHRAIIVLRHIIKAAQKFFINAKGKMFFIKITL